MTPPKKPKKVNAGTNKFPGMKKKIVLGRTKAKGKKKYEPFTYHGRLKYGLSDYQKRTMNEFMKVRPGETIEQWKVRTRYRRVKEVDEIKEMALTNPLRINLRNRERNVTEVRNKFIMVQPMEREFDFMRYYGIVINYYSIKYGVRVEDMQLGFYFYSNIPFTKTRFENAAILHLGTNRKKLYTFIENGLLEEIFDTKRRFQKENITVKTNLFRLTKPFIRILTEVYKTLGMMNGIKTEQQIYSGLSPEIKQIIEDMNQHVMDIQTGRKPQEKIK